MERKKVILVIMDGWGLGKVPSADAIQQAQTPFVQSLYGKYPHTTLVTCGEAVGLPDGQMGNSEVGHLNLGAGRIVYQELQRINVAIRDGDFYKNSTLLNTIRYAKTNNKPLHLMGLVSDGGVHSHINHLKALTSLCATEGLEQVYIHAFTDGRDTDPKGGLQYMNDLLDHLQATTGKIATISGRYFAMDRDRRWERVKLAYDAMVNGTGVYEQDPLQAITKSYINGITDEFILPVVITSPDGQPLATINDDDAVICFNFRTDRCREITEVLTQQNLAEFGMITRRLYYTTMTEYNNAFKDVHVIFETDNLNNTLGEVLAAHNLQQIRIAETEKYPHVTFFFNGGREIPFAGERRIMIPSPKVATYDLKPSMSAFEVTEAIVEEIEKGSADFICLNFANADMVGHTGVFSAAVEAVETVDTCVARVASAALPNGYTIFLTADHGNADYMVNPDGSPNTAHTLNLVPFFVIDQHQPAISLKPGKLGDIAPTILTWMNLPVPPEMTGDCLITSHSA